MVLKPQDLLVVLKLWAGRDRVWTYQPLADELGMSLATLHGAVKRAHIAGLLMVQGPSMPVAEALREFLIHGARYAFPAQLGQPSRGIPTAHAAAPLREHMAPTDELPPVWAHAKGTVRGIAVEPLHGAAPEAALKDPALGELLALLDAIRIGRARDRKLAAKLIEARIQ